MKTRFLLSVLLACAAPLSAQPTDDAPKLVNDLPFRLVAPDQAQKLAVEKPIVLHLQNVTLAAALDELKQQSGVEFIVEPQGFEESLQKTLSLDIETPSFGRALTEILDEAGVKATTQRWDPSEPLRLMFGQQTETSQTQKSVNGLFQFGLNSVGYNLSRSVDLSDVAAPKRSQTQGISVTLALSPDLRLPVIGSPQARATLARDEQGRSLLLDPADKDRPYTESFNSFSFYSNADWQRQWANLNLRVPAPDAKTLARLEGVVVYALITKAEKWELPDLLSQNEWTHTFKTEQGDFPVKIKAKLTSEGALKVRIEATSPVPNDDNRVTFPLASYQLLAAISIRDAKGTIYRNTGSSGTGGQTLTIDADFVPNGDNIVFPGDAPKALDGPLSLTFNTPIEIVQTQVPFSFENVPLP